MDGDEGKVLRAILSPLRLQEYEELCGHNIVAALRLHCWNTEVSEAFYGSLQYLELGLRNAMDRELVALLGAAWWDAALIRAHYVLAHKIDAAREDLRRRRKPVTPDRLVGKVPLGFWVALLGSGGRNQYETRLWRPALRHAFPGYHGSRKDLYKELDRIRTFRNRIAHHQPIHHRHLEADHASILRLTGYISPELERRVRRHSRVPEVLARRPAGPS